MILSGWYCKYTVSKLCKGEIQSALDNCFHVQKEGKILKFWKAARRLYYFDTDKQDEDSNVLITTVEENKANFSAYYFSRAKLAQSIQSRIGHPNVRDFVY